MDVFLKNKPTVVYNYLPNKEPVNNISSQNFIFSIYDQATIKPYKEIHRKLKLTIDYGEYLNGKKVNVSTSFFKPCNESILEKYNNNLRIDYNDYFCFPDDSKLTLQGKVFEGNYTMIRVQISFCINNTNPKLGPIINDCYPRNFIEKNISGIIQMHYIIDSANINQNNFKHPVEESILKGTFNTNINTWGRLNILYKIIEIQTDSGFFFQNIKSDYYQDIDKIIPETVYSPGTDVIFSLLIANSLMKDVYERSYIKVQNVFALMGGFVNAFLLFFKICLKITTEPDLIDIFNNIYRLNTFQDEYDKNNFSSINLIRKDPIRLVNQEYNRKPIDSVNKDLSFSYRNVNDIKKNDNINIDNIKLRILEKSKKNYSLNYPYLGKFCIKYYKNSKNFGIKDFLYDLIKRKFMTIMSIENIIKITRDCKVLKFIYLEEHEQKMLKFLHIPRNKLSRKDFHFIDKLSNRFFESMENKSIVSIKMLDLLFTHYNLDFREINSNKKILI